MPAEEIRSAVLSLSVGDKSDLVFDIVETLPPEVAVELIVGVSTRIFTPEVQRRLAIESAQFLPDEVQRDVAFKVAQILPVEAQRNVAFKVAQSLPNDAMVDVIAHLIYTMPPEPQQNLASEVVATLPSEMKTDIVTEAVGLLAPRDQENLAMRYRSPAERRAAQERLIIIVTFVAVFVGITAAFIGTVLWKPESVQYMTPILTSIAGALAGFVGGRATSGS